MNDEGVYRTAPATPGLLKTIPRSNNRHTKKKTDRKIDGLTKRKTEICTQKQKDRHKNSGTQLVLTKICGFWLTHLI